MEAKFILHERFSNIAVLLHDVACLDGCMYDVRTWELVDNRVKPTGLKALTIQDFVKARKTGE